jgi:hypothetical protein
VAMPHLSYTGVADEEELEKIIVFTRVHDGIKVGKDERISATCGRGRREEGCVNNNQRRLAILCTWPAGLLCAI